MITSGHACCTSGYPMHAICVLWPLYFMFGSAHTSLMMKCFCALSSCAAAACLGVLSKDSLCLMIMVLQILVRALCSACAHLAAMARSMHVADPALTSGPRPVLVHRHKRSCIPAPPILGFHCRELSASKRSQVFVRTGCSWWPFRFEVCVPEGLAYAPCLVLQTVPALPHAYFCRRRPAPVL